ncbi:major facilitator superfamily permease [Streptomyces zinciresistens K42]|uniref:Major facilitator superfamily permease n=1 Tax=Streptomyces zinciresistens K42 TaxID=700597 RepID=G2GEQ4_9ACTN|nr:MFS transporter [Streptomyces zinciresistens]EGX58015.1 major facilitator superfamily permease [Streptomyces zinciresistens K42]
MRTPTAARVSLYGLLSAYTVSLFGTRLTMIALPWLVLVTSGSASQTGLIVFAEAVPLVLGKALAGPLIDRFGARRFSVAADLVSAAVIALIPLGHLLGTLPYGLLLALSTLLGLARGPGDVAKRTLTPETAEAVGMPLERVSGMVGTLERLAGTAGPAAGGAVVAFFDPVWALAVNGVTFLVSALIIAVTGPGRTGPGATATAAEPEFEQERYLDRLRAGLQFLRQDRLLRSIAVMLSVTNLIDAAYGSLLIPVWAKETGGGPAAIGALGSVFGIAAVAGSALATALAHRLRRRPTYVIAFLLAGPPRFLVMAFDLPLWTVLAVAVVDGLAIGFVNPILNAVMMERIPRPLLGRVSALTDSVGSAGVPLGPILAGFLVTLAGLGPVLVGCAALYLASTVLPALRPHWRELDDRPPQAVAPEHDDHKAPAP